MNMLTRPTVLMAFLLSWPTLYASAQNMTCTIETICEQIDACREIEVPAIDLIDLGGGFRFDSPSGTIELTRVGTENDEVMMLQIPMQNGFWGMLTIFHNGSFSMSASGLQNSQPYTSSAFGHCQEAE